MCFRVVAPKKQTSPPTKPMMIAYIGVVKPAAGVITTRPATAPEIAPSTVGFPPFIHSMSIQPTAAAGAGRGGVTNALLPRPPADRAEPALKPNQPTHSRAAPITL